MQLSAPASRAAWALAGVIVGVFAGVPAARADGRISVRGAYYREASTRIVQPMVQVAKVLPGGFDVGAHYLLDAITSASIAQGAAQDVILEERRNEVGVSLGKMFTRTRVGAFYRFSSEPDYVSHTVGASLTQGIWDNSGTLAVTLARGWDHLLPNEAFKLAVQFVGLSYTQAVTPTTLAQVGIDRSFLDGFQANQYLRSPSLGRENLPPERVRYALAARVAQYLPPLALALHLHYRFYVDDGEGMTGDPWGMTAHTTEVRLYRDLSRDLELRLSYRFHTQSDARFWCDTRRAPACYGLGPEFHSVDEKLGGLATHMPEAKLTWRLHVLRGVPVLKWFSSGFAELSYARFFQETAYGDAHLVQVGYGLPL